MRHGHPFLLLLVIASAGCSSNLGRAGGEGGSGGEGGEWGSSGAQVTATGSTGAFGGTGGAATTGSTGATSGSGGAATTGSNGATSGSGGTATTSTASSTGSSSSSVSAGAGGNSAGAAGLCVDIINQYRATLGLPPYARWTDKESCADGQAQSDAQTMQPHGAFGQCTEYAQNECPGWSGTPESIIPGCLQMMWAEGPGTDFSKHGHYINMSSTQYTKVACGFYVTQGGKVWSVQDFR